MKSCEYDVFLRSDGGTGLRDGDNNNHFETALCLTRPVTLRLLSLIESKTKLPYCAKIPESLWLPSLKNKKTNAPRQTMAFRKIIRSLCIAIFVGTGFGNVRSNSFQD